MPALNHFKEDVATGVLAVGCFGVWPIGCSMRSPEGTPLCWRCLEAPWADHVFSRCQRLGADPCVALTVSFDGQTTVSFDGREGVMAAVVGPA